MTTKVAQPTLHHINLKTTRLQEMIDWYGTVVGSKPNFQFPGGAWLTNDGANHRIALLTSSKMSDDPDKLVHTGMHHVAFEYDTRRAARHLLAAERARHPAAHVARSRHDDVVLLRRSGRKQRRAAIRQLRRLARVVGMDAVVAGVRP